ncbi:MAG TPA: NAD(P)H-dependent oxidoreductase, partial [Alphaproteobacteria bacterium]|nr:NAD(P)H-dependent oxidoreductase [Alphaproteobacteria bacterium]
MNIAIICGSHRQNSQSLRISNYLATRIKTLSASASSEVLALTGNPLPLWDDENNSYTTSPKLLP